MFIIPDLAPVAFTKVIKTARKEYVIKIIETGNVSGDPKKGYFCWVAYVYGKKVTRVPKAVWQEANRLCAETVSIMPYCLVPYGQTPTHTHNFVEWTTHKGEHVTGCRDCGKIL